MAQEMTSVAISGTCRWVGGVELKQNRAWRTFWSARGHCGCQLLLLGHFENEMSRRVPPPTSFRAHLLGTDPDSGHSGVPGVLLPAPSPVAETLPTIWVPSPK